MDNLQSVIDSILHASKSIAFKLKFLYQIDCGPTGYHNIHGEDIQQLDQFAHDTIMHELRANNNVYCAASEEHDHELPVHSNGDYVVIFDPLDGSSNIDVNSSVGTIFSIYHKNNLPISQCCVQTYDKLLIAGYVIYGSSTIAIVGIDNKLYKYILKNNDYTLVNENLKMPENGSIYSINEGNQSKWCNHMSEYVSQLRKTMSLRYVGTLVADFHRTLLKGGIFLYPSSPKPKLRLMYEVFPMSKLAEIAGGHAKDENGNDIKNILPTRLHQKISFIVGSSNILSKLPAVDCANLL
jgi:fructose-1,6-bisphosphatase I